MQPDESVARIKNEIELNIYSMVRKSKRDVESINIYVKKRYNYLENQLASTQKKIDLFNGLSLFFKRLSDRKSSIPLDDSLFDREVAKILEKLFKFEWWMYEYWFGRRMKYNLISKFSKILLIILIVLRRNMSFLSGLIVQSYKYLLILNV